ncbi:autotransporter outer membrane beta-barrel domain-containing protein [Thorsellia anophelis]|uniref:Autotransporter domain-containing protein n=1 Tax=Thorsellia anophelis DSM 18579 TaxID=1123402 RepID=A0A1H9YF65_9GAMM|nr:autotransporter outer membrane beta-barrel domain-containing protein [Thorsellia anophelis]SES67195.1 hypothetical protein SAMN02583745_00209 [Thorsellia anophelis DSM 18579]
MPKIFKSNNAVKLIFTISGALCLIPKVQAACNVDMSGLDEEGSQITCVDTISRLDLDLIETLTTSNNVLSAENVNGLSDYQVISAARVNIPSQTVSSGQYDLNNNRLMLTGQSILDEVYAADIQATSGNYDFNLSNNNVEMNDNAFAQNSAAARSFMVYAGGGLTGKAKMLLENNRLVLNNFAVTNIASGVTANNSGGEINLSGNSIILNDNTKVEDASGATAVGVGNQLVTFNSVTLNHDSRVTNLIQGGVGSVFDDANYDITSEIEINVSNNTVTLNDTSEAQAIFGGLSTKRAGIYPIAPKPLEPRKTNQYAINNIININDSAKVSSFIFGGYSDGLDFAVKYDLFSGNTLNFTASPITLSYGIANIEHYNFTIDPTLANTNKALIQADLIQFGTNAENTLGGTDKTSKIAVVGIKSGNQLFLNDEFILMRASTDMRGEVEGLTSKGIAQQGVSLLYDIETKVDLTNKLVTATVVSGESSGSGNTSGSNNNSGGNNNNSGGNTGGVTNIAKVNPQLKSLSEGHLSTAMLVGRASDIIANDMYHVIEQQNLLSTIAPFISFNGGLTRYNSGSHIDSKEAILTGGLSYRNESLTTGIFIESGWGSYDTYNSFENMADVKANGHNRFTGAGLLTRYSFDSGMYLDGALRLGKSWNTYSTQDIQNLVSKQYANYQMSTGYYGMHLGAGYQFKLDEQNTVDVSSKYLWTQLNGDNVVIAGDEVKFKDINSHRAQLNARVDHQYTKNTQLKAGVGYEYEFDAKASAQAYEYDILEPSLQGSTGTLLLGTRFTPTTAPNLDLDFEIKGYLGKREGVSGNIQLKYAF